jgi:hypothetical protein
VHSFFDNLLVNSMAIQIGVYLGLIMMLNSTTAAEQAIG